MGQLPDGGATSMSRAPTAIGPHWLRDSVAYREAPSPRFIRLATVALGVYAQSEIPRLMATTA